ncbi:MAG TPA: dihydrolipoamide acetyltransferase family protein [Marmoricola sp.]|nr:dihydrolipoamide acetyltransferase family protein [Marmoricola sp.]
MSAFTMPSLGADMEEGTLLEWLVHPGDTVHRGDAVAVVDTAKAAIEVESFVDGVVGELLVQPGTTVPVGTPLAEIGDGRTGTEQALQPVAQPVPQPGPQPVAQPGPAVQSPLVRRLAEELGVPLATVTGTGSGGRITRADVRRAAASPRTPEPVPARGRRPAVRATPYARRLAGELGVDLASVVTGDGAPVTAADVRAAAAPAAPPAGPAAAPPAEPPPPGPARTPETMRAAIAGLMSRSKREIPHYYLTQTIDLAAALDWMQRRNTELPVSRRLVPAALLLRATALAAEQTPELNGSWVEERFRPAPAVHLGVAVSVRGGGLVTPALHDAAALAVEDLMAALRDLVTRARAGRLRGHELTEATLTVTNLGDQGVESVLGVIYPPQVALVGFGRVVERPWAVDGLLGVRPVVTASLSADHRASDAMTGARFLARLDDHLQRPEEL